MYPISCLDKKKIYKMSSKFNNPAIVGPGIWFTIHHMARYSITPDKINNFINFIHSLTSSFPCEPCKKQFMKYVRDHPLENYRETKNVSMEYVGMFIWSWKFHNAVNERLRKPLVEYEVVLEMFSNPDIMTCKLDCDEGDITGSNDLVIYGKGGHTTKFTFRKNR